MRNPARFVKNRLFQFIFIVCVTLSLFFPTLAFGQTYDDSFYQTVESNVPNTYSTKAQAAIFGASSAMLCILTGYDVTNPEQGCLDYNPTTQKLGYTQVSQENSRIGGLLGFSSDMIALLYTPPASSLQQVKYYANNFGIDKSYAQTTGVGFTGLEATQDMFIKIRNIAYVLIVIVFIVIGMAIMLRVHVDPRTVMTIQNQIPKVIIGILLITFSYSIAGLLIDVMWTFTYFGINTITADVEPCGENSTLGQVTTRNILNNPIAFTTDLFGDDTGCFGTFDGVTGLAWNVGKAFGDILSRVLLAAFGLDEKFEGCDASWYKPWEFVGGECLKQGFFGLLKYLIGIIAALIITLALLITLFRIWFTLLKAYISITIAIILAPLWIIAAIIPGGGFGFGQWLRHMVSHLAVFPATVFMIVLASVFARNSALNDPNVNVFLPPLIGNPNIADSMGSITALAFLLFTPDMLNVIRDALNSKASPYTANITGRAKGANPLALGAVAGGYASQWYYMRQAPFLKGFLDKRGSNGGAPPHPAP